MNEEKKQRLSTAEIAGSGQPERVSELHQHGSASGSGGAGARMVEDKAAPLFGAEESQRLRSHWDSVQTGFVDEPRRAVEQADSLVADAIKRLAEMFAEERKKLEMQWDRGDNVSTEDLRVALQRYRSFFSRLLSI